MKTTLTIEPEEYSRMNAVTEHVRRLNAIASQSLGIGVPGSDPTEDIVADGRYIPGQMARRYNRHLELVGRITEAKPKDALRKGFKITVVDDPGGIGEAIEERLRDLDFNKKAFEWLRDINIYNRGGLFYPIIQEKGMTREREHISRPLYKSTIEKIEDINVIPEEYQSYIMQNFDPHAKNFGGVKEYYIQGRQTHPDRIFHYVEDLDISTGRGVSLLERILLACKGVMVAEWTIQNLILRYRALLVKYPSSETALKDDKKTKALQKLLDVIKLQFTSKSVASVPSNYDFQYLETKFTGIKEGTDFLFEYLSSISRIPQSEFKGAAKGEIASGERDMQSYYEVIQSEEQESKLKPLLEFFIPYILWEKEGKVYNMLASQGIDPDTLNYKIEFNPLKSSSPMQEAQIDLIKAQTHNIDIANGVLRQDESREKRYPDLENFISDKLPEGTGAFEDMNKPQLDQWMEELAKIGQGA